MEWGTCGETVRESSSGHQEIVEEMIFLDTNYKQISA
jgi:hypothetical protein